MGIAQMAEFTNHFVDTDGDAAFSAHTWQR